MTPKQIQRKYKSIQTNQAKLKNQLTELQELCQHPNVSKKHWSNTGNYDPANNEYWIIYDCPDCARSWQVEQ